MHKLIFSVAIILILLFIFFKKTDEGFISNIPYVGKTVKMCTNIDGNCYSVQEKYAPNTLGGAADMLGKINNKNLELIDYMKKRYLSGNSPVELQMSTVEFNRRKNMTLNLIYRYDPNNIVENSPKTVHNTSYVYGKGKQISFCLRDKKSGENILHPFELLYFVNLHELAHIAGTTYDTGHSKVFWRDFKILLEEAERGNIYKSVNYGKYPARYCGIMIDYNPLHNGLF